MNKKNLALLLSLLAIVSIAGCDNVATPNGSHPQDGGRADTGKHTLRFCLYASEDPADLLGTFTPLLRHVEEELQNSHAGLSVGFTGFPTYEQGIAAISSGECDFTRTGPASYILAKRRDPGIRLIAMEHIDARTTFRGMIVARRDSPIEALEDLAGTRFAFGSQSSTIGRYLSQAELASAGIYSTDLKGFDYLGRHDLVARSVISGKHDAGAIKERTFEKYRADLKPLHQFVNVTKPWFARSGMDDDIFHKLRGILVSIEDEALLATLGKSGFTYSSDDDYDYVRQRMKASEQFHATSRGEDGAVAGRILQAEYR